MPRTPSPFSIYSWEEERLVAYVIRRHRRGETFGEVLDDLLGQDRPRSTNEQKRLLLSRPDLIRAIADDARR